MDYSQIRLWMLDCWITEYLSFLFSEYFNHIIGDSAVPNVVLAGDNGETETPECRDDHILNSDPSASATSHVSSSYLPTTARVSSSPLPTPPKNEIAHKRRNPNRDARLIDYNSYKK